MITQWILQWTTVFYAASLFFSQTSMDVFGTLMLIALLWMGLRWKEQLSRKSILNSAGLVDFLFPLWVILIFVSFAVSGFINQSWYNEILNFKWIIGFYALATVMKYLEPNEKILLPAPIVLIFAALYAGAVWFLGFDPITSSSLPVTSWGAVSSGGFLANPEVYAQVVSVVICLVYGLFFAHYKWREKSMWILLAAATFLGISLLLTMRSDLWVVALVAIVLMIMTMSLRLGIGFLFLKLLGFYILSLIWTDFGKALSWFFHERIDAIPELFQQNFEMARENLLTGIELGHPATYLGQYDYYLVCTGILGLLIFLSIQIYFLVLNFQVWFRVSSRNVFHQGMALGLLGAQFSILLSNLFYRNFDNPIMINVIIFAWALVVWLSYEYRVIRERV